MVGWGTNAATLLLTSLTGQEGAVWSMSADCLLGPDCCHIVPPPVCWVTEAQSVEAANGLLGPDCCHSMIPPVSVTQSVEQLQMVCWVLIAITETQSRRG